jgi:hypothetical protein
VGSAPSHPPAPRLLAGCCWSLTISPSTGVSVPAHAADGEPVELCNMQRFRSRLACVSPPSDVAKMAHILERGAQAVSGHPALPQDLEASRPKLKRGCATDQRSCKDQNRSRVISTRPLSPHRQSIAPLPPKALRLIRQPALLGPQPSVSSRRPEKSIPTSPI